MEPEGSLSHSQELSTCPCPEPDQSSSQHSILKAALLDKKGLQKEINGKFIYMSSINEVFGNDSNKSKFDSGGNQEEIEFW
jgi:hypothetical protein